MTALACLLATTGVALRLVAGTAVLQLAGMSFALFWWIVTLARIAPDPFAEHSMALVAAGMTIAAAAVLALRRWRLPWHWLLVTSVALLPLRVPFELGDERFNLLVPLYAVLATVFAADIASLEASWRQRQLAPRRSPKPQPLLRSNASLLEYALAALLVLGALSVFWSAAPGTAAIEVALFWVPFALLLVLTRRALAGGASRHLALHVTLAFIGVVAACATVGLWQATTRVAWQNPKLIVANTYTEYFRTNSLFWDPNIYGRYLMAGLLGLAVVGLLAHVRRRALALTAATFALLAVALWFTYSQSSLVGLAAGALVLSLAITRRRSVAASIAAAALLATAAAVVQPALSEGGRSSGRLDLASGGLQIARDHPVTGVGLGGFEPAYVRLVEREEQRTPKLRSSHSTPITVAAELGILGFGLLLAALYGVARLFARMRSLVRLVPTSPAQQQLLLGKWAVATFAAVTAHSLFYAGLFEDPLTWLCAGVMIASFAEPAEAPESAPEAEASS